jgi:hypothetical protein
MGKRFGGKGFFGTALTAAVILHCLDEAAGGRESLAQSCAWYQRRRPQ